MQVQQIATHALSNPMITRYGAVLPDRFHDDDVVLDIGCGGGSFSRAALGRGARHVCAVEPAAHSLGRARKCLADDIAAGRIDLVEGTVWSFDAAGAILRRQRKRASKSSGEKACGHRIPETHLNLIKRFSLDVLIDCYGKNGTKRIALAKLDCKGGEWSILAHTPNLTAVDTLCGTLYVPDAGPLPAASLKRIDLIKSFVALLDDRGFTTSVDVRNKPDGTSSILGSFWARNRGAHH